MCTVTWFIAEQKLQLWFNRDEQKTRSHAQAPEVVANNAIKAIYPIDPDGGGTWMSVNNAGIIVCLLNNYRAAAQNDANRTQWTSRGKLVQQLATLTSHQAIASAISSQDMAQYRAFHLMVLSLDQQIFFNWDGRHLTTNKAPAYYSSSSFDTANVLAGREKQYQAYVQSNGYQSVATALDFHRSHLPQKSAYSVCMHRDDANSTSLSHLTVTQNAVSFCYWNAPPCESVNIASHRTTLSR